MLSKRTVPTGLWTGVFVCVLVAALTLSGCGGSSKPPEVSVTASATTVDGTDAVTLTATVTNDKNTSGAADGVSWSVSGGGTLSNPTTSSATYTAPAATTSAQTVTVTATSVADTTKTGSVTLTIPAAPAITAPTSTQLTGAVGSAYSLQLAGTGGISPYTWTLTAGTLPTGWTLTPAGLLSGPAPMAGQAGTINLTFKVADSGTPTALTATLQVTVTIAAAPGITFAGVMPATATYNTAYTGSAAAGGGVGALTYSVASGTLPPGLTLTSTATGQIGGTPTVAGTYNFSMQAADAFGDSAVQAYTITVNPVAPQLSFASIPAHTYGDAPFAVSASSSSSGAVTYSVTSGPATINALTGQVMLTGAGTVVLGASQVATTNYTSATASTSFTVNKAAATVNVSGYTVTYDGSAHTATATATGVGGATLPASDVTLTGTSHTNAGAYATDAWSFTDASGNYADASGTVSDKINQATATVDVTGYSVTYDNTAHTATATVTGIGGASLPASDVTLTGTSHTNAGTYGTDAWSFSDPNGNYVNASGTVSDSIAKAAATVNVTGYTVTYDGTAHTAAATATGAGGAALSASDFTLTGTSHTNAGNYTADAWSFADPNYVSQNGTVNDKINPATATINVAGYTVTYDTKAHTATATATGAGGANLAADLDLSGTSHTNAGTYPNDAWSFTDPNGNYLSANGAVSDTINLATPTLAFAAIPAHTYGDAAFTATASSASSGAVTYSLVSGPATIDPSSGLVSITAAGSVKLSASQAPTANYNAATATITFTVNKANATIHVTGYSVTYDTNAHTATATATGVGGVNLLTELDLSNTTHTNAGTYATDAWSFTDTTGNYNNASGTVADTIAKAAATVNVTGYTVTYDATAHTAGASATGIGGAALPASDFTLTATTHTNAGSYATDAWSFADANYASQSGTVSDSIAKAAATVNVTGYTVTYDATAHTATASATGIGGAALPASDFTLTATTHTNAGSYGTDAWSFADANYASQSGTVSDSIAKAAATVNVTGYTVTYNGSAHTAAATATGVGGVALPAGDFTLTGTSHTNVGTYNGDPWSFADQNYVSQNGTVNDTINQANATINVTGYTVTYDGNSHTATATATGAGGTNLIADLTLGGTTHTNAGTYNGDAWSFTDPIGNYAPASGTVNDKINQAAATINVTPYTVTYDGNAHTAPGTATGVGGVNLIADLTLSGTTHTNAGTYNNDPWSFSDASGNYTTASGTVNDKINPATPALAFAPIGTKVNGAPPAGDGTFTASASSASSGAVTYSVNSGPATINSSTGLVTLNGSGTVSLHASQAASGNYAAATADTSFQVNPTLAITTGFTLPTGTVGTPYSQQMQATGGIGGYSWATNTLGTNNLSNLGLVFSNSGVISGATPVAGSIASLYISVTDTAGHTAWSTGFSLAVTTITINTTSLPLGHTGSNYSQQLTSSGGAGGNVWSVSGTNNLSTYGLLLSSSGLLSGSIPSNAPVGVGIVSFTAQVKDQNNATATKALTITIYNPLSLPSASALHAAITGADYGANNVAINASGGSGSYSFSVNSTAIPTSNSPTTISAADSFTGWNSGGNTLFIGGTPPSSGTFTLNVTVTDTGVTPNQSYGPIAYTITVGPQQPLALPDPSTNPLPTSANINQSFGGTINASGGANGATYSFSVQINGATTPVSTDNTPAILINGNGLTAQDNGGNSLFIGGTPTVAGNYTLQVTVSDSANDPPATQSYTTNIINPLAGYNVSGTVSYSGSKTGWIYLQLKNNNCGDCGGPGTAIQWPGTGAYTIKGVPAGNYTAQAYMDPIGFGAPNANDPSSNLYSNVYVNVSSAPVTNVNVSLGDPSAVTLSSAPSIGVSGTFATGAFVQLGNLPTSGNGVEMATSYTVRWSTDSSFATGVSTKSFPATGGSNYPLIVSGLTNGQTLYFEARAVAGSSNSSWSAPTSGVQIVATPASGNNAVSGQVTFAGTATGPLYVGLYDQNTGNIYSTVVGSQSSPPTSPASYSLYVPTGNNYFAFGVVDNKNNGVVNAAGVIENVNQQGSSAVTISGTTTNENISLPANNAGTAPLNSAAQIRIQHTRQTDSNGTNDGYGIDIRVDGLYKLPASVEVTSKPAAQTVIVPSDWATSAFNGNFDEFDFQLNLNGGTPQVGDAYNLLVAYTDGSSETLTVTVGTVLNAFATLTSPAALATGVSPTPNFSWSDPAPASSYTYEFQLQDTNHNTIWQVPAEHSHSNGLTSSTTSLTWGTDPTDGSNTPSVNSLNANTTYQWSIQATDANGNSATRQVTFTTGEAPLTLPDNSNPGSALVSSPYSQSLNVSGGSGTGFVFTVNSSSGTTVGGVTTWTLTDGLTASVSSSNPGQLTISGTPTSAPATVTAAVSVVDSQSHSVGPLTYTIDVTNGPNGAHNSYLSGTYVCKTDGFNDSDGARYTSLSTIVADGNGHFSSGIFDNNGRDDTSGAVAGNMSGTYSIGSDNNGAATISGTFTSGASGSFSNTYALALTDFVQPAQEFRMVESDDLGSSPSGKHSSGDCYLATTAAFSATTFNNHGFAFGLQGENGNGVPKASAGRFSASGGSISSGILDGMRVDQTSDNGGTFTGSYTAPDSTTGRFTLSLVTGGGTVTFVGYAIDAQRMFLLETTGDSGLLAGDMRTQQQTSYSTANLSGPFVLYSQGFEYSNNKVSGYDSIVFQASSTVAGSATVNQSYQDANGSYQRSKMNGATVGITFDNSNVGRSTLAAGGDTVYWYFYDYNSAFHLDMGTGGYLETGWVALQSQSTFTGTALAATYLFGQMPAMQSGQNINIGELTVLSNGNITAGITDGGQGEFAYDQSQSMGYTWDPVTSNTTGAFQVGSSPNGASCVVVSAAKAVCIDDTDSSASVKILHQ